MNLGVKYPSQRAGSIVRKIGKSSGLVSSGKLRLCRAVASLRFGRNVEIFYRCMQLSFCFFHKNIDNSVFFLYNDNVKCKETILLTFFNIKEAVMKNRVYHRMCSLLLAALTIFAALPVITLPVSAAESISTGDSVTISRETEFVFTPAQSGTYSFYSDGITSGDPKGYLYDAGHTQLAVNDDSNSNRNFTLNYALTAGQTYYLTATPVGKVPVLR